MNREAESFVYTESTALLTALDWIGLDWIRWEWELRGCGQSLGRGRRKEEDTGWGWVGSEWDAAIIKATQTACRYSHRKHRHHHIAFQSLA